MGSMEIDGHHYLTNDRMERVKFCILEQIELSSEPMYPEELVKNVVKRYPTSKISMNEAYSALNELLAGK